MLQPLFEQVRLQAVNIFTNYVALRMSIVDAYDPQTLTCVRRFQPKDFEHSEDSLSPALLIAALAIGNRFWVLYAPNIGNQVVVHFKAGSNQVSFVYGRLFSIVVHSLSINAEEYYLIHQTSSFVKLMNSGDLLSNGYTQL